WYWVSDEPWAWATYHYGRWQLAGGYGWVWVPETVWAPAWVSWREGGGYVGWAPMPPEPRGGVSVSVTIAHAAFCFVDERHMHDQVRPNTVRSEEHTSELQSRLHLVCRLLLEKK